MGTEYVLLTAAPHLIAPWEADDHRAAATASARTFDPCRPG